MSGPIKISRGTSGNLLYDMQVDMHKKYFPGWVAELSLYNAVMAKGFAADGKTLKMDFAEWSPQQRRLLVDLTLQLKGGASGYLGTATAKELQTAAQDVQGKVVAYDFAGVAHSLQYDMILEQLNSEAGAGENYVRKLLAMQMETFKNNANLLMVFGKTAQVAAGATYAASGSIDIVAGNSVQNLYVGQLIQDKTAVSTSLVSGAPVAAYHGLISGISDNGSGGYTITYTKYDGSTITSDYINSTDTTVHLHGQYNVSPYGLFDFVTADNTVGDLARSGQYNPYVVKGADLAGFTDDPALGLVRAAAAIRRNTSNAVKVNMALMSEITWLWMQKKYANRLQVQQRPLSTTKVFGFDPIFQVSPSIVAFVCDSIPDGEMWMVDSENIGFTPLPGNAAPEYVDQISGANAIRIHGTLNKETALAWFYQMYARHLGGFGRVHTIALA